MTRMNNIFGILALLALCFLLLINKKTNIVAVQFSATDSKPIEFGRENETNGIEWEESDSKREQEGNSISTLISSLISQLKMTNATNFPPVQNDKIRQLTELLTERYLSAAEKLQSHCPNRLPTSAELEEADEVPGFRKTAIPPGKYYIRSLSQQNLPMTNRTYGAGYFDRRAVVNAHDERFVPTTLGLFEVMSSSSPDDNSLWFRSPIDNAFVVVNTQLFRSLFMDTYSETLYGIRHGTKFEFYTPNDQQNITAEKQLASGTFRGILREKESKLFLHFQEFLPLSAVNGMNASDAIEIAFEPSFVHLNALQNKMPNGLYHIRPASEQFCECPNNYLDVDKEGKFIINSNSTQRGTFKLAYNETDSSISLFSTAHGCFLSFNHRPTFFFFSEKELDLVFTGTNSSEVNTKLELLMLNPAEGTVALRIELTEHRKVKWLCVSADESMVKTVDASEKGASVPECAKFRFESIADNNETIATK